MQLLAKEIRAAAGATDAVRYLHATRSIHEIDATRRAQFRPRQQHRRDPQPLAAVLVRVPIEDAGGFPENSEIHADTLAAIVAGDADAAAAAPTT